MKKVKRLEEITDYDKEVIKEKYFIFGEKDNEKMFDSLKENNFKKNHVCEYVLGNEKEKRQKQKREYKNGVAMHEIFNRV